MIGIKKKVYDALNLSNNRNRILAKNIGLNSLFQAFSVFLSIALLPISLSVLTMEVYGIWLTINSVLMWLNYLDLGLGSGLKNKLGEAIAQSNYLRAKRMISTAYFTLGLIMLTLAILYFLISRFLDFALIFGNPSPSVISPDLLFSTVNVVIYFFLLRFFLQLINSVMDAVQKLFWTKIIVVSSQFLIISLILISKIFIKLDVVSLGLIFSLSPVICLFVGTILFFGKINVWRHQFLK
jgi:Na+-driven multidrug efflux pump